MKRKTLTRREQLIRWIQQCEAFEARTGQPYERLPVLRAKLAEYDRTYGSSN